MFGSFIRMIGPFTSALSLCNFSTRVHRACLLEERRLQRSWAEASVPRSLLLQLPLLLLLLL